MRQTGMRVASLHSQRLLLVFAIGLLVVASLHAGLPVATIHASPLTAVGIATFHEDFAWQGNHAATIKGGTATTVWWNEDNWDVRADTAYNSAVAHGGNEHTDIHRSVPDLNSGVQDNAYFVGGDGSPGVGIMHLEFEAISSARLRNPMLISADQPGVVEFRTTNFVTTGHWWELAITPAGPNDIIAGGEATAVPSPGTGPEGFAGNPGPGSRPAEDSINFITIGDGDVPCITGWEFLNGIEKSVGGVDQEIVGPAIPTDPSEKDELYAWRFEYYPDRIVAFVDLDEDGTKEHHATFNVTVPWDQVYVQLIGVAYQADHHPQGACFQGEVREIPWKDVTVQPVKYARTASYPKNEATRQVPKETGWTGYDIRDTQRFGPTTDVPQQPNAGPYKQHRSFAFCNGGWFACNRTLASKELTLDLPAVDAADIGRAQLVYDVRGGGSSNGWGDLRVNGVDLGRMPGKETTPGLSQPTEWAQRSIDVPPSLLQPGQNTIRVTLQGDVAFDRLHFELAYFDGDDTPPSAPSGLTAAPVSTSEISLSWAQATDPDSGIDRYEVYRDGASVGTARGTTWNDSGLLDATSYRYEVSAVNGANLEGPKGEAATATTDADEVPPVLREVTTNGGSTEAIVVFSEAVDATSATNPANYSIDNGITISAAALGSAPNEVTLTTSDHTVGATYVLTVNNVLDRARSPNAIAPNSQVTYSFAGNLVISGLSVASGRTYVVVDSGLTIGALVYIDRGFTVSSVPTGLAGLAFIKTANDDKLRTEENFLSFSVNQGVTVFVAYDSRAVSLPNWLSGWTDANETLGTTDVGLNLYSRDFAAGPVTLGANSAAGSSGAGSNYSVIVAPGGTGNPGVHPVLGGMSSPVRDNDGDGRAEDVNGNGLSDFADVVGFFVHLDSSAVQDNPTLFDYDNSGQVGIADVLALFDMLMLST